MCSWPTFDLWPEQPANVYTAVILIYMNAHTTGEGVGRVLRSALLPYALTLTAQFSLAFYLRKGVLAVDGDLADNCYETAWWLKCVALFAFVGLALKQMLISKGVPPDAVKVPNKFMLKEVAAKHGVNIEWS